MLQRHRGGEARGAGGEPAGEDDDQYSIPLLDEVVVPGTAVPEALPSPADAEPEALADDEPSVRRRLAERIASEIEVIVQDRLEAALARAGEEIREQVRNHMDIILPEIVEELTQARRRRED